MVDLSSLSNEDLIALYKKTDREVKEGNKEGCGKGEGAKLYPILCLKPRPEAKPPPQVVEAIYCPGKNKENEFTKLPDVRETMVQELVRMAVNVAGGEAGVRVAEKLATTTPIDAIHVSNCPEPNPPKADDPSNTILSNDDVATLVSSPSPSSTTDTTPDSTPTPAPIPTPTPGPTPTPYVQPPSTPSTTISPSPVPTPAPTPAPTPTPPSSPSPSPGGYY